jgi:pSer/pThr/pTyr-binding forkhead associated (FHA) protein
MEVVLVMFKSDGNRRSFSLRKDMTIIGRREDCDLRIPLGEISRKHCRLIKEGDTLKLEDLGSSNGTYHNGVRIQESTIQPGDTVQVGSIAFVVQIDSQPGDEELQPILTGTAPPIDASAGSTGPDASAGSSMPAAGTSVDGSSEMAVPSPSETDGEFDPMSILDKSDSQIGSAGPLEIDMEQSHHGQNAEA